MSDWSTGDHVILPNLKWRQYLHRLKKIYCRLICRGGFRGRVQGVRTPPPPWNDLRVSNTTGILQKGEMQKTMCFIGVEVEQETSAPPPNKNPGSAPDMSCKCIYGYF